MLAPRPNLTCYYFLSAMTNGGPTSERTPAIGLTVGLGPLKLPEYLNRTERAVRVGPNQLRFLENQRWTEPLEANVSRVLSQNLRERLETARILTLPTVLAVRRAYDVPLEILRFESTGKGDAELSARWGIKDGKTDEILVANETHIVEPATGPDAEAAVAALSRALGRWSDEIGSALLQVSAAHPVPAAKEGGRPSGRAPKRPAP
jgi:hypothetical protein